MPRITDDDDVNLDDLDTEVVDSAADDEPDEQDDQDAPDDDSPDDERDSDGPSEDDDESGRDGEVDRAARGQREDRREPARRRERSGTRGNDRIRTLTEELADTRRRFDEYVTNQQRNQQQAPRETEAERNARRALMSETERMAEDFRASEQRMNATLQHTTFTVQDQADRSIFEAKAVHDPLYKKWASKVEAERARLASQGANVSREAILRYMLGDAALQARGSKTNETRRAEGRRRVQRERVPANDTRNDATQSRRGSGRTLEDRLANVPL